MRRPPKIRHYINGNDYGEPREWQNLELTTDWTEQKQIAELNIKDLSFVLSANRYLQKRLLNGLTGGVGIFEGEPYTIELSNENNTIFRFNGYLDFTDEATVLGGEEIQCTLKKLEGGDWLNDVADGFSFAYLANKNFITKGDYVKVPYVINYIPDNLQVIMLTLSIYMMTKELIENVQKLAETIGDVTDASTPVVGTGVGLGAVAVIAYDIGNYILVAIKAIARIAYIIAMVIAIKNLIEEVFEQILPKKRYHLGMTFRKMLERGCQYLGLTFQSSIQQLEWVHIPRKDHKGGEKQSDGTNESGFPTNSGPIYTFGDLIRTMKEMFNADYIIENGVFKLERKDNFEKPGNYSIPNFFNEQDRLLDVNTFNTNDFTANYNIAFAYDIQDQNTLDNQTGRVFQAITTPNNVINQKMVNMKGLAQISLPFTQGVAKQSLTKVEEIARDLGKFVDKLTGIFGKGTNYASKVRNRVGSLNISSHYLTIGKVVAMSGSKLDRKQREKVNTTQLWFDYHYINSFAEINGRHNQFFIYKNQKVPMSLEDYTKVIENNLSLDKEGNRVFIDKIIYTPEQSTAIIDYRINKKYTTNLKIEYV